MHLQRLQKMTFLTDMDKVILLALWLAPCKQLHCIGTVNGGAVQELHKYNSWVTAPYIDLSEDMEAMWTKYLFYIDYQGPLYRVDGSRRYVKKNKLVSNMIT
jgi:hypothetical protein